jgi:ABC-type protease/lipase transport system fused ATPase/permease subunit
MKDHLKALGCMTVLFLGVGLFALIVALLNMFAQYLVASEILTSGQIEGLCMLLLGLVILHMFILHTIREAEEFIERNQELFDEIFKDKK